MPGFIIFVLFLLLVAGFIVISSLYVVKQQSVAIIERFGRYQKISDSGIHMRAPFGIDKIAAQELAEADKIKIVTAAEAEAEKDRLHGVGIAEQRKAIVDGLADSIKELKGANVDLTEEQIMSILLTNQYLDTLNNFADKEGNNTIFLPANPDGVENIRTQILSALKAK